MSEASSPLPLALRSIDFHEISLVDADASFTRSISLFWSAAGHQKWSWFLFFRGVDVMLRATEPLFPKSTRKRAIDAAVAFVKERLNGEDGLGAIYPAMANSVMMYDVLGYPEDHPDRAVARLSIDRSGIGMNLAENLSRDFPQVVGENFTNEAKERWATDFKILLQRRDVDLPRDRELVAQLHSIKRRVMPSGNVTFEAERTNRGHADRFWAIVLACQKERGPARAAEAEVGVRVIG